MNAIAKILPSENGQTVLLPPGIQIAGTLANVRMDAGRVILEPVASPPKLSREQVAAWFASIDKHSPPEGEPDDFMADREQPDMAPDRDLLD